DMIPTRPHGVERIDHGFYRGARCLIRNYNKIILKRNSNILNTLLETIELCSIYIAHLKPVSPIILQEAQVKPANVTKPRRFTTIIAAITRAWTISRRPTSTSAADKPPAG